jgi:hypothetical protein
VSGSRPFDFSGAPTLGAFKNLVMPGRDLRVGDVLVQHGVRTISYFEAGRTRSGHRIASCGRWQVAIPDDLAFAILRPIVDARDVAEDTDSRSGIRR